MSSEKLWVRCMGRWPEIVATLTPHRDLLDAIERGPGKHGPCPVHGGLNDDAFRVFEDFAESGGAVCNTCGKFGTGFQLLMWLHGWDAKRTGQEIRRVLEGDRTRPAPIVRNPSQHRAGAAEIHRPSIESLQKLWDQALPLTAPDASPVRRYFASRGLAALELEPLVALRCHPNLSYYDRSTKTFLGRFPALVAYVTGPDGQLVALHRTYLTENGEKAPVAQVKKLRNAASTTASGGAVRLHAAGEILTTCEGLENGLTTLLKNRLPLWVATSAPLLATLSVPKLVRHVVIWGDYEPPQRQTDGSVRQPGRDAAEALALRLKAQNCSTEALFPRPKDPREKRDWNGVLLQEGRDAIPQLSARIRMLPTAHRLAELSHALVIRR